MVKAIFRSTVITASLLFLISCSSTNNNTPNTTYYVSDYQNLHLDGTFEVNVVSTDARNTSSSYVVIDAPDNVKAAISVEELEGTLLITVDENVPIENPIHITIGAPKHISEIRLKSDHDAVVEGHIIQDGISIAAEAQSNLILKDLEVKNLLCQVNNGAEIELTNHSEILRSPQTFTDQEAVKINETTLLVNDCQLYVGEKVEFNNSIWTISGKEIKTTFIMDKCIINSLGSTTIEAVDALSKYIDISIEGTTSAKVFAIERLTGRAEGNSTLHYIPVEGINILDFKAVEEAVAAPIDKKK
ncbi:DUF2807 domain-containing protein [Prolixibacteraceae bacterium]|nr:DUF2807 domain-containing protein [Prolixibacteraceae bacterium]